MSGAVHVCMIACMFPVLGTNWGPGELCSCKSGESQLVESVSHEYLVPSSDGILACTAAERERKFASWNVLTMLRWTGSLAVGKT